MKTKLSLTVNFLLLALIAVACGGLPGAGASPAVVEDQASLIEALRARGAAVEPGEPVEQIFFAVTGQIIAVNGEDVQVFEYDSAEAMQADAAQVASDGGSIGTNMVTWVATPHFYNAGRILVLYVGDDPEIIELLEGVLGPQFAGR
jgi:hypothetical protein